ncbi:MAG: hypothetical protein UZ17_ACD001000016 [Acidobacteria bacterium OLB17]|nr:MAG: hypothetical protein UZ17_ACD001000016 [Acidobacteria bacterium OLB17]MCZ2391506.1 ScyD/ScyE family protein [Acidobacteriota bacterium]
MKMIKASVAALLLAFFGFTVIGSAQTTSVLTGGLHLPTKVITGPRNSLLVSEDGTPTPNTGSVVVVDRTTGEHHALLSGLPSGVDNLGGPPVSDGTTGIYLDGRVLYVTSGVGDATTNIGGVEYPTGAPSSPLFCSVMQIFLPRHFESLQSDFHMTLDDQNALADGRWVRLTNAEGYSAFARVVANLPDYRSEPRPGIPNAVRSGHIFGVTRHGWNLYLADASFNLIYRVNLFTGRSSVVTELPTRPNPLFGTIGGPTIEAVPNNIHTLGNKLLVTELTGFPLVPGQSDVRVVDPRTGAISTLIAGLSSTMDVLAVGDCRHPDGYYTLEFSTNQLAGAPGRMQFFDSAGNSSVVVPVLITPSSMARDDETGDLFVTNIFPGTITRVQF